MMGNIPRPPIYRIPLAQLAVLLPLGGAAWFYNPTISYSLILGGLIHLLPNTYFAMQAFRYRGAKTMRQNLGALAKGEVLKFLLNVMGIALAVIYIKPINIIALICAFVLMTVVNIVATAAYIVK